MPNPLVRSLHTLSDNLTIGLGMKSYTLHMLKSILWIQSFERSSSMQSDVPGDLTNGLGMKNYPKLTPHTLKSIYWMINYEEIPFWSADLYCYESNVTTPLKVLEELSYIDPSHIKLNSLGRSSLKEKWTKPYQTKPIMIQTSIWIQNLFLFKFSSWQFF